MDKISHTFANKITNFQKRIQSFLENDFHNKNEEQEQLRKDFEATRDTSLIRGLSLGLPDDHIDRAIVVFSRIAMFFDAGILLENNDGKWKAQAFFYHGITELFKSSFPLSTKNPSKPPDVKIKKSENFSHIQIPALNLMTVLKTDSITILKKLGLEHLDKENKTSCLLIKVTPDFAFILFSTLPDLWLKEHMENIRYALINGFAD